MLLLPLPNGEIDVWVCGNEAINESLANAFKEAVHSATAGLSENIKSHKWSAFIGATAVKHNGHPKKRLKEACKLPGITLVPTNQMFWLPGNLPIRSPYTWGAHATVPILVRSASPGYDWSTAQPLAAEALGKLVSFLSLAWGTTIDVLDGAVPLEFGERRMPRHPPWLKLDQQFMNAADLENVPGFEHLDWLSEAWVRMNKREKLKAAVTIYMEGLRTEDRHPSLALVSYVAAVEAISLTLFHEERCATCKNHKDIGKRFHEALKLAVGEDAANALRPVYGNRSKTVHTGRLFGSEVSLDAWSFGTFLMPSHALFESQILHGMKDAARKLLLMAVRGQLPAPRAL
ncbi:hypothetical protein [Streptomyces sp. NPDC003278]|uniref:hypothetical protein n=1 Tax=Streptomyces sp. NPDC003278 TaxID=3364679 RepID=UPI00367F464B